MKKIWIAAIAAVLVGCTGAPNQNGQASLPPVVDCASIAANLVDHNWPIYGISKEGAITIAQIACNVGKNRGERRAYDYNGEMKFFDRVKSEALKANKAQGYPDAEAEKVAEFKRSAMFAGFTAATGGSRIYKKRWNCDELHHVFWTLNDRQKWGKVPEAAAKVYIAEWCQRGRRADLASLSTEINGSHTTVYTVAKEENEAIKQRLIAKGWMLADADSVLNIRLHTILMAAKLARSEEYWPPLPVSEK